MSHFFVQIKPSNHLLVVKEGETVLDAALRSHYEFPYSCGSATCGTCMGKVISGSFTYGNVEPYALDTDAREQGFALFCSVQPTSDMIIELEDVYSPDYTPVSKQDYKIVESTLVHPTIYRILLNPSKKGIPYQAGQHIKIAVGDEWLPFSIANAPDAKGQIELHIKKNPSNPLLQKLIQSIEKNDSLTLRGPYGKMRLQPEVDLPLLFVAGGTGIVPFKALIDAELSQSKSRRVALYWGVRDMVDLYLLTHFEALAKQYPRFQFVTNATSDSIINTVLTQESQFTEQQVYASGSTEMVYACLDQLTAKGLKPQLFYSDTLEYFPR